MTSDYAVIFRPFADLFNQAQVNAILLAWLPTKMESYLSGIMAVDMFITTIIASGISVLVIALCEFSGSVLTGKSWGRKKNSITIQVEYYTVGTYGDSFKSIFYESLSWLISQQTQKLEKGSFIVQHANSTNNNNDPDKCEPPNFNVLPEKDQKIVIEHKGRKFDAVFKMPEQTNNNDNNNNNNNNNYMYNDDNPAPKIQPSIYLTTVEDSPKTVEKSKPTVDIMTEFLNDVTRAYLEDQKKTKVRSRYERTNSFWYAVQSLSSIRGLDTVALDEPQEKLLKKELETFVSDKDFYERIGMPYRRGILLYGKPGTGKTSLINAISSQLSRNVYYLNLKTITDDNDLSSAFSAIPANQIIVLEDVDTQSKILHKRKPKRSFYEEVSNKKGESGSRTSGGSSSAFSLSTFLGCLDGHIISEGNIIIMTTNHVEVLDDACVRPGRMDVHFDLGYCTHYQIQKMYKSVVENSEAEFPKDIIEKIPERLLPPCEVMMTMVLYRKEIDLIPQKVYDLVSKYINMKPEDIAKQMEEEILRIEEESENLKEVKEVKEVKDENDENEKEEEVETDRTYTEDAEDDSSSGLD